MRALLVLVVCAAVLGIGGCGGGNDSAPTTSSTSEATPAPSAAQTEDKSTAAQEPEKRNQAKSPTEKAKSGSSQQQSNGSKKSPKLVRVPPISSAPIAGSRAPAPGVKTVKGADNSVQEYGVEADASARREAAIALQAYLNARAEEDWGSACTYLAQRPKEQLERLQRAAAKQGTNLDGCAPTMALLKEGEAQSREQATIAEVLSFRGEGDVSGNPSYLIFTAPPANTLYSMPMYSQAGGWKVGLARAAELPVN
jgi:hypothetical protein